MKRNKSGLVAHVPPEPEEPLSGPGSAVCYCRVMDRRMKAEEAHAALRAGHGRQITNRDGAMFADIFIGDLEALDEFYEAARYKVEHGTQYRLRVAVVA